MVEVLNGVGDLNPYALDYPVCTSDSPAKRGNAQRLWQLNHQLKLQGIDPKSVGLKTTSEYEPCEDDWSQDYLNQASVKAAIHVKKNIKWESCSYRVDYSTVDSTLVSTAPVYNYLIDGNFGLDILVYSGDDDGVCATIGTQSWIWDLGYDIALPSWATYTVDEQTAGYLTKWKNTKLAFLTIHGAGHEVCFVQMLFIRVLFCFLLFVWVPTYKPSIALDMWKRYLAGEFTNK
jgi:hypothetical protein